MTEALAEALSEIEDPKTILSILEATDADSLISVNTPVGAEQPTLSDLYERFLSRRQNRSPATRAQYKRTIPSFVDFAKSRGITHPAEVSTGLVDAYVDQLQITHDTDATIVTFTKNVRTWLRWLSKRNLCEEAVYRILDKDELGLSPNARDEAIPQDEALGILQNLRRRRRGSAKHALTELFWNGGPRIGGVHSTDLSDFDADNNELQFRHRPETGTRLKNGSKEDGTVGDGERNIELKDEVVEAIQLYIDTERPDVTDEYGREPLFATQHGRASRSTLRRWVYEATSCRWSPENLDRPACDGSCDSDSNVCPQSYYPHAIRRGAIVHHLSGGLRPDRASERFDVSVKVIKEHYDPRTKRQRKEDRSEAVRNAWDG
jgi:site-specific recombinase XerD